MCRQIPGIQQLPSPVTREVDQLPITIIEKNILSEGVKSVAIFSPRPSERSQTRST